MEREGVELKTYLAVMRRWLWLIVLAAFLAGATARVVSLRIPIKYQAEAGVLIVRSGAEIVLEPRYTTLTESDLAPLVDARERRNALTALVANTTIASQVIEELGSILEPGERQPKGLVGMVEPALDGDLIRILVKTDSPEKAISIANAWAHAYEGYVNSFYVETSQSPADLQIQADESLADYKEAQAALTEFTGNSQIAELNRQIEAKQKLIVSDKDAQIMAQTEVAEAKRRYKQAEEARVQFVGDNRIDELSREIEARKNTLFDYYVLKRRLDNLIADAKFLHDQLREGTTLSSTLRDSLSLLLLKANAAGLASGQPAQLQFSFGQLSGPAEDPGQQLLELDAFLANLEARRMAIQELIDESPLQQEILQLEAQLQREQATERELNQARDLAWEAYQNLAHEAARLDVLASDSPALLSDQYSQEVLQLQEQLERERATERELTNARDLAWETYELIARKMAEMQMAGQAEGTLVRFAVPATWATPIRPRTELNTFLASMVGAMLAVGVAFLIEYLDDTIRTPEDVRQALGLTTLGSIAPLPANAESELVTVSQPHSPASEAFRILRTQLQIATDKPPKAVLVTSPNPLEGKSTVVANLGAVMAQAGRSTIIVDSDMRRPVLHEMFGLPNAQGLSNALSEDGSNLDRFLEVTGMDNLRILTSGPLPPNPSELLSLPQMEKLIEQLRSEADVLLFDSPAASAVTDAALLAEKVDGVLLVVESGGTQRAIAQQTLNDLTRVGANLVGVVLNRFRPEIAAEYYYLQSQQGRRKTDRNRQPLGRRLLDSIVKRIRER